MKTRDELRLGVYRMVERVLRKVAANPKSHVSDDLDEQDAAIVREEMVGLADVFARIVENEARQ